MTTAVEQHLRAALAQTAPLEEKRMFGGIEFIWRGNMLCGIRKDSEIGNDERKGEDEISS